MCTRYMYYDKKNKKQIHLHPLYCKSIHVPLQNFWWQDYSLHVVWQNTIKYIVYNVMYNVGNIVNCYKIIVY